MSIPTRAEARALLAELIPNYYLIENRRRIAFQPIGQYNDIRRTSFGQRGPIPQGQLHSFEFPHTRSLIAAAEFIVTRKTAGSYHGVAGDDHPRDVLPLAPIVAEVWHCIPSNPWAIGWSVVMQAHTWRTIPRKSRDNLIKSLAYGFYLSSLELIALGKSPIPARQITKAQAMAGVWGFNMHRHMDPGRRSDLANPESDFPWAEFFAAYLGYLNGGVSGPAQLGPSARPNQEIQFILNVLGYYDVGDNLQWLDGIDGPAQKAATAKHQLARGLRADGWWGPTTETDFEENVMKSIVDEIRKGVFEDVRYQINAVLLGGYTWKGKAHPGVGMVVEENQRRIDRLTGLVREIASASGLSDEEIDRIAERVSEGIAGDISEGFDLKLLPKPRGVQLVEAEKAGAA